MALGAPVTAGAGQGGSARNVRARRPRHGARQSRHSRSGPPPGPAAAAAVAATIAAASARAARRREPGGWEPPHGRGEARPGPGGWGKGRNPASGPQRGRVQGRKCSLPSQVAGPQAPLTALAIHEPRSPGRSSSSSVVPAPSRPQHRNWLFQSPWSQKSCPLKPDLRDLALAPSHLNIGPTRQ